jgi:hypothetical protein
MSSSRSASVTQLRFPMFGTRLLPNADPKVTHQESVLGSNISRAGYGDRTPVAQDRRITRACADVTFSILAAPNPGGMLDHRHDPLRRGRRGCERRQRSLSRSERPDGSAASAGVGGAGPMGESWVPAPSGAFPVPGAQARSVRVHERARESLAGCPRYLTHRSCSASAARHGHTPSP